jgi:hypothetical protein
MIAGIIEERGIERLFAGQPSVAHLLSFVIRTGNTFLGSLLWVRLPLVIVFMGVWCESAVPCQTPC